LTVFKTLGFNLEAFDETLFYGEKRVVQ